MMAMFHAQGRIIFLKHCKASIVTYFQVIIKVFKKNYKLLNERFVKE